MISYIDLFAGAGGLSEGFAAIGCHPIAHVEMNSDACNTLRTRACYYYLKQKGDMFLYRKYLSGLIPRDELYDAILSMSKIVLSIKQCHSTMDHYMIVDCL